MRAKVCFLVLVVLTAPIWSGLLSSQVNADGVLADPGTAAIIYEVCPAKPEEFVTILNTGIEDLNANRLKVTDGEGTMRLPPLCLGPGNSITLFKNSTSFEPLRSRANLFPYVHPDVVRKGQFTLADDGDQVMLTLDDVLLDSYCYGNAAPPSGWSGEPFRMMDKGHMAVHDSMIDTESSSEQWSSSAFGRTSIAPVQVDALVTPVIHPDDGAGPIVDRISRSGRSIAVSVYTLEDPEVACALASASRRGVDVDVLLEGQPVGGLSLYGKRAVRTLLDSGADLFVFRSNDSYRRYEFLHAKYAIFDDRFVSISSENWGSGLSENRGWGVIIDSSTLAAKMKEMFDHDSDRMFGDVQSASDHAVEPFTTTSFTSIDDIPRQGFNASVRLISSPDMSCGAISDLIDGARERICIEAMSMDMGWMERSGVLGEIIDAARSGVQVRILLDRTNQFDENDAAVRKMMTMAAGLPIECRMAGPYHEFSSIHNKGMIVDDKVLVSSINLVNFAFNENREVGVVVGSAPIADALFDLFIDDWNDDMVPPTIVLPSKSFECKEGDGLFLDASGSFDNSEIVNYSWDVGNDGTIEGHGPMFSFSEAPGDYMIVLSVEDRYGNRASENITVTVGRDDKLPWGDMVLGAPAACLAAYLGLRTVQKRIKSK